MADFGTDISCYPGLDPQGTLVSGNAAVLQAIARRLTTPRGGLFYDPNYGTDVRGFLNEAITNESIARWKTAIERECRQDQRVASVVVDMKPNAAAQSLTVHITCTTADGPFAAVFSVTSLTLDILKSV
jgi:phage baseplate assembly protein W